MVYRVYAEKRPGFDVEAQARLSDFRDFLGLSVSGVRQFVRYDVEGIDQAVLEAALGTVFSEPMVDECYLDELPPLSGEVQLLAWAALPGQYDQRADSCAQCIQILTGGERPDVHCATVLALSGVDKVAREAIANYVVNPVECREVDMSRPESLKREYSQPSEIPKIDGFVEMDEVGLLNMVSQYGLAMDVEDLRHLQCYFQSEKRDPTLTELRVVDTYWSDHCRHTTFLTRLERITIDDPRAQRAYEHYLTTRRSLYGEAADNRPITLMDVATCAMKALRQQGRLPHLDESEEINACSVHVSVDVNGEPEDWLLMFKNETHNHPTEIEPFGGAATCIGGAIRDPLSGRSYVYQAMRVTGTSDPRRPLADTLPGKLPQRKLTTTAAAGYASYGNQIGLATGIVDEFYHPGFLAKRMEIGAVVGAAPASQVIREKPEPGDVVILLGGRTGRDGIGGATGSSKSHTTESVATCAAEVQKGNAPEERKLQRLFRNPEAARMIRRCNDFGAGGVAVAIGELAPGLKIDLNCVPKKYDGLDGTELAISESQERMAVVVAPGDVERFRTIAESENLESTVVAQITAEPRLVMEWKGQTVVDIARAFLDSNGAPKTAEAHIPAAREMGHVTRGSSAAVAEAYRNAGIENADPDDPATALWEQGIDCEGRRLSISERLLALGTSINLCDKRGLVERFDGTIGASTVLMPHGGTTRRTPSQVMAALLPVENFELLLAGKPNRETTTCSVMSFGFDPDRMAANPFDGAALAVVESVSKLVAAGCSLEDTYLSLQEYFPNVRRDPKRWGLPLSALLGAYSAQMGLGIAGIGGKDSMSGSFQELDVPPTLVSFAITIAKADRLLCGEFQKAGNKVYCLSTPTQNSDSFDYAMIREQWERFLEFCNQGKILSARAITQGGMAGTVAMMSLGNRIGFRAVGQAEAPNWFKCQAGAILFEANAVVDAPLVGYTTEEPELTLGKDIIPIETFAAAWSAPLAEVFPLDSETPRKTSVPAISFDKRSVVRPSGQVACPRAVIPVFPGTNCEYDTARALAKAGALPGISLIRNLNAELLRDSIEELEKAIRAAQMLVIPGGFSGGDEPDGSAKFIVACFRNPRIVDAVRDLLQNRDGLILGICNGFQALIKLGLVPYGDIVDMSPRCPTITYNTIGRHQSRYVHTRVASTLSPWLMEMQLGQVTMVPISHGEGRFVAGSDLVGELIEKGQVAFQYCDSEGHLMDSVEVCPNGALYNIEGITSPDGRVLGKMGHSERAGELLARNIPGDKRQLIFESGVRYFKS